MVHLSFKPLSNRILMIFFISDCGSSVTIDNGQANFTDALTTYGQSVSVICNLGYRRTGGTKIECLADGTWSKSVTCELVGIYTLLQFACFFFKIYFFKSLADSDIGLQLAACKTEI